MIEERSILLVEDSPTDEVLTLRALEMNRIHNEVIVARDGVEALDYLFARGSRAGRDSSVLPALVLLDLNLPKINGIEVLQQIRANERTKLLPVVILTSSDEDKDRLAGYLSGCNSYVQKPVDFEQFAKAVRQLGLYWLVLNKAPPQTGS
jgi:two-component system response regulator